jgi:hypothetical protein
MNRKILKDESKLKLFVIIFLFLISIIYFVGFLTPSKIINGSDYLLSGYSGTKGWVSYIKEYHRLQMWDSYNFSGHPRVVSTGGAGGMVYPPFDLVYMIFPIHLGLTFMFIIHVFLAGLGVWLLLREFDLSQFSSLLGAVSYMFAGQIITTTQGGHLGRTIGGVLLPFAFLFVARAMRRKRLSDFLIFGGISGMFILAGHPQITYWSMIGVVFFFIYEILRRREEMGLKKMSILSCFFSVGIVVLFMITAVKFIPPLLSLGYGARGATRGYAYTTSWSVPTAELFNLIIPHFSGILDNYWGENFFKLDSRYLGILPIILVGLAFFYRKKRYLIKYFAWFTCITLILALGKNTPIFRIYYYLVPMAKKFRAPSMFFFLTSFGIAVLAGFGAEALYELKKRNEEERKRAILYVLVSMGLILFVALIVNMGDRGILNSMKQHFSVAWSGIMGRQILQQKIAVMSKNFGNLKKSLWLTTLLFIINGGIIISVIMKKLEFKVAVPILLLVLIADQWAVDKKYLNVAPHPRNYYSMDDVTRYISQDKSLYRIFPFENYKWAQSGYFHYHDMYSVAGYGPNPPGRYQKFIGAEGSVMFSAPNFFKFPHALSMLNVKYLIVPRLPEDLTPYTERIKQVIKEFRDFYSNFDVAFTGREYQVLKNESFLPRASLIYDYKVVEREQDVLNGILSPEFSPGDIAILEEDPNITLSNGEGVVDIIKIIENEKVLDIETSKTSFLIIRENYHPDWKCYVDGKKAKIYKANYIFYGVFVPEGEHELHFVYESRVINFTLFLYLIGLLITAVAFYFTKKAMITA